VRCPTLVLAGKHDGMRGADVVKPIADAIPGSRYLEIDSGHFMAVQTPETFLAYALPFLRGE
jgi:3-oxoadipate enol-lactonase